MEIVFNELRDGRLTFFGGLGNHFYGWSSLENRLENKAIFVMQTDPETLNWGRRSTHFGPSKDIHA